MMMCYDRAKAPLFCLVWLWSVGCVCAYSFGPPVYQVQHICKTLLPDHGAEPMSSRFPFEFHINSDCYRKDLVITVTLKAREGASVFGHYLGFMLQGRVATEDTPYGTFEASDAETSTYPCGSAAMNTIGHNVAYPYTCKTFYWTAPEGLQDKLFFLATVVHSSFKFWANYKTVNLTYNPFCVVNDVNVACGGIGAARTIQPHGLLIAVGLMAAFLIIRTLGSSVDSLYTKRRRRSEGTC